MISNVLNILMHIMVLHIFQSAQYIIMVATSLPKLSQNIYHLISPDIYTEIYMFPLHSVPGIQVLVFSCVIMSCSTPLAAISTLNVPLRQLWICNLYSSHPVACVRLKRETTLNTYQSVIIVMMLQIIKYIRLIRVQKINIPHLSMCKTNYFIAKLEFT